MTCVFTSRKSRWRRRTSSLTECRSLRWLLLGQTRPPRGCDRERRSTVAASQSQSHRRVQPAPDEHELQGTPSVAESAKAPRSDHACASSLFTAPPPAPVRPGHLPLATIRARFAPHGTECVFAHNQPLPPSAPRRRRSQKDGESLFAVYSLADSLYRSAPSSIRGDSRRPAGSRFGR